MIPVPHPSSNGVHRSPALAPSPPPALTRVIDLAVASHDEGEELQTVSPLVVREVKGPGNFFTANYGGARAYYAIPFKAPRGFDTSYQLLSEALKGDSRIQPLVRPVVFVPAYTWNDDETVLMPVKRDGYGQTVLLALRKLQRQYPDYRAFKIWDDAKKRHRVQFVSLDATEREVIGRHDWPTDEEIVEALSDDAFDTLEALADANPTVRALLASKEVG